MAIARPVRALGLAAIVMWCFFVWQLIKPTASPVKVNDGLIPSFAHDPNLDRKDRKKHSAIDYTR